MRNKLGLLLVCVLALALTTALMWGRLTAPSPRPPSPQTASSVGSSSTQPSSSQPAPSASQNPTAAPDLSAASSATPSRPPPTHVVVDPRSEQQCPADMVLVEGFFCPFVAHRCQQYLGAQRAGAKRKAANRRCRLYRDDLLCEGRPSQLRFCIDRYEYPNLPGSKPVVLVDYVQAREACAVEGKRLCEREEWALACEGAHTWPYPYGIERDPSACNIDRRLRRPNPGALAVPHDLSVEVERLDQRVASGGLSHCVSPFGVFDMTGNVAEWVHDRDGERDPLHPPTVVAGDYWRRAPATCRSVDKKRRRRFRAHWLGFRCCANRRDGLPPRHLLPKEVRLPRRRRLLR